MAVLGLATFVYFGLPSLVVDDEIFNAGTPDQIEREQQRLKARNDVRTSGLALLTLAGVVAGSLLTWRTVRLTREGQLTDRYARSVEALGDTDSGGHVGAVLSLEGVARTSRAHHGRTMQVLLHHLRETAGSWTPANPIGEKRKVPAELDTLTTVIGRRRARWDESPLNLSGLDLRNVRWTGANLDGANLSGSNLSGAFLEGARLRKARMQGTHLKEAHLERASFRKAVLTDAIFDGSLMDGADIRDATHIRTSFKNLKGHARGLDP
jgi:hypothetical protein